MAYSEFTLKDVKAKFGLTTVENQELFTTVPGVAPSELLRAQLRRGQSLALSIGTEKAKSELITAPILSEVWDTLRPRVGLFSGNEFPVDPGKGLTGRCDFILTGSSEQEYIAAPVLVVAEGKNDLPTAGFGQAAAGMVAAVTFNQREGTPVPAMYGASTAGTLWRFLKLDGTTLYIDPTEYHVSQLDKILGVLHHMLVGAAAPAAAA